MKFFVGFKIYELGEERGHKGLHIAPYNCHFNPTEPVWSPDSSNIGWNGFGMEPVKKMEELLEQVCTFVSPCWVQSKGLECHMKSLLLLMFCNIAVQCRQWYRSICPNFRSCQQCGKLCVTCSEADGELGKQKPLQEIGKPWILLLLALKRPPMEMIQMPGESHLDKHCEYQRFTHTWIDSCCYSL
jgi:hypothetical protein